MQVSFVHSQCHRQCTVTVEHSSSTCANTSQCTYRHCKRCANHAVRQCRLCQTSIGCTSCIDESEQLHRCSSPMCELAGYAYCSDHLVQCDSLTTTKSKSNGRVVRNQCSNMFHDSDERENACYFLFRCTNCRGSLRMCCSCERDQLRPRICLHCGSNAISTTPFNRADYSLINVLTRKKYKQLTLPQMLAKNDTGRQLSKSSSSTSELEFES